MRVCMCVCMYGYVLFMYVCLFDGLLAIFMCLLGWSCVM